METTCSDGEGVLNHSLLEVVRGGLASGLGLARAGSVALTFD